MSFLPRLLLLLLILPTGACARDSLLDVQVLDLDQGHLLARIPHAGRDYLEGRPGHRFAVSLQNLTGERVLAVLSVDGVNAISGQTAGASQAGYVLEPWQQVEVRGWRKSHADIAEFYFTDLPDSYAARTGRPDNVGVIGVAAFRERRPAPIAYQPPPPPMIASEKSAAAGNAAAAADSAAGASARAEAYPPMAARQQLGTGHGERRYDPVMQTQFERASRRPAQTVALFYDSLEALAARGILHQPHYRRGEPEPFPIGFTPDPPR